MSDPTDATFVTKVLVPRRRADTIRRARLLDLLREAGTPVAVVRAPAGFGKTTLLVDLVEDANEAICWLSLDDWDRDVATLLRYLYLSASRCFQWHGHTRSRRFGQDQHLALASLSSRLAEQGDTWMILDDVQCLAGASDAVEILDYFCQRLPPNCRIFLASRTQPPLPSLPRLRVEGKLSELGPEQLLFTRDEIKEYYRIGRRELLTDEAATGVLHRTRGWPAGVVLLSGRSPLHAESEDSRELADYLAAEILNRLPIDLGQFLLTSSVFDALDAGGCDYVLRRERSSQILASLATENVPVLEVTGASSEYRLHPLFRDFLRSKLGRDSPDVYRELSARAGEWQIREGRVNEAISLFARATDWDKLAAVIEQEAPGSYASGRWHTITTWLDSFPQEELQQRPRLRLWEARMLVRLGQAAEALAVISDVFDAGSVSDPILLAEFETLRGSALRVKGNVAAALETCRKAVEIATQANAPIDVVSEARKQLGQALYSSGAFLEAAEELRPVLDAYERRGNIEGAAFMNGLLGSVLGSLGKPTESALHLERARQQLAKIGNAKELSWVLNNLAMTYWQMGQTELARELFTEAIAKARASGHQRAEGYALVSLADLDRQSGHPRTSIGNYEDVLRIASELGETTLSTLALTGLSHAHRQLGDARKSEVFASQALVSSEGRSSNYEMGLARLALGRLRRDQGLLDQACADLSLAASMFERSDARRELAEALLFLADAAFPARQGRSLAVVTLDRLARLTAELEQDQFLIEAARETPQVVRYAASRRIGGDYFRNILRHGTPPGAPQQQRATYQRGQGSPYPVVEASVLGAVEVTMERRKILSLEWATEKSKELFLLLLTLQRSMRRDEITTALWPDVSPKRASSAFHSTLYRLRRALYPECIVESSGLYSLQPKGTFRCDATEFQTSVDKARDAGETNKEYEANLRAAVALYHGSFAPDLDSDWAKTIRVRLDEQFLDVAYRLINLLVRKSAYPDVVAVCERVLNCDPYNENACYELMRAQASLGDADAALRTYRRYSDLLEDELGETPGAALIRLRAQLRDAGTKSVG